ncbi:HNH endonuclease [Komagataeibacter sp. FNDCR1]|nr:HNH endonuclease [Komagataeibacter sp. FNDCR1]
MARIRSIHPGLWTDEDFVSMSMEARILYIGIWSESDDQGAFAWKPRTLKARILPGDNVDAVALLQEMIDAGLVRQSEDEGSPIGLLKNFCKWQRPKKPTLFFSIPEEMRSFVGLKDEDSDINNLRKAIWARFEGRCFYCGTEVTYYNKKHNSLEIDHVVPVSKDGSDDESNLACSCRNCNRSKNDLSANDFFAFRKLKKLPVSDGFARLVGEIRIPEKLVSECENENSHCENGFRTAEGRKGGREEGNTLTTFGTPAAPSSPDEDPPASKPVAPKAKPPTPLDQRSVLFGIGSQIVGSLTGKPPRATKSLIGKWLRDVRDDCAVLNGIIQEAADTRPADPVAWISGAVKSRGSGRAADRSRRWALDGVDLDASAEEGWKEMGL